jgi:Holliday junction resolvasome RuvABC endonuclease subunit
MSVLSLDVSASNTGWCFTSDGKNFSVGNIRTKPSLSRGERLSTFSLQLIEVLLEYTPDEIVLEDTFAGKNVKTLKILSEFAGVAKYTCYSVLRLEPYIVSNHTVKSFFKVRNKKDLFNFLVDILDKKDLSFTEKNDIIDATAQLMCYTQDVLHLYCFREEKDYGFVYSSIANTYIMEVP